MIAIDQVKVPEKDRLTRVVDAVEKTISTICVAFMTLQVISIIVMVFGRYFFRYVPRGSEEFALFCMVWFSLLSISLSIRDDSHIKMEIMDFLVPPDKIKFFQYFSSIMIFVFSIYMVVYGIGLVKLTWPCIMSGFRISEGWLYMSVPVSGVFMALSSLVFFIEKWRKVKK